MPELIDIKPVDRRRIIGRLHEVVAESKAAGMVRKEIIEIIEASVALDASPYGETPASLTALSTPFRSRISADAFSVDDLKSTGAFSGSGAA